MRRIKRALGFALALGLLIGALSLGSQPAPTYADGSPTPTPTSTPEGTNGVGGGGHTGG